MNQIYNNIITSISNEEKLLAVLLDPDKMQKTQVSSSIKKIENSAVTHIFVGGSTVEAKITERLVSKLKTHTQLPIVLFPGDVTQITNKADGLLFLSLISGRNPEYLIEKQVQSVSKLRHTNLEIIPTGYILIENGKETTVQKVTQTIPLSRTNIDTITDTAKAGELLGMKLIYLEAGSGAKNPITKEIINFVKQDLNIPLIVGGGIKNKTQLQNMYDAGADLVVVGTAFENDESFFDSLT